MLAVTAEAMRSPLAHVSDALERLATLTAGAVTAAELGGLTQISLRATPELLERLPFDVPTEPNTATSAGGRDVLWLGPDEWLLVTDEPAAEELTSIDEALAGRHHAAIDVGANRAIVELHGEARSALLASRCPIDLDRRSWSPGRCAQTLFGRAQVLLHERNDATRLFVRPSFGGYLVDLLVAAAAAPRDV
jgi:sarcosine oxidase subunit gamma